jgi:CRP/FNR family cyclic AMP-dependent transcriptional regulator
MHSRAAVPGGLDACRSSVPVRSTPHPRFMESTLINKYEALDLVTRHWDVWPSGSFLSDLPDPDAKDLLMLGELRRYRPGATLIRQGDTGDFLLLLIDGTVKVFTDQEMGGRVLQAVRAGGDVVGEFAYLDKGPRTATVEVSRRACEAVYVPFDRLDEFVRDRPAIRDRLTVTLGAKNRAQLRRRADGPSCPPLVKMARVLLELIEPYGRDTSDGRILDVGISQQELGTHIHVTRNKANSVLRKLVREGVIAIRRQAIVLLDERRLRELARI